MKLSLSLILIVMITVSCEGPIGPAGPEGEQGTAGEQGITGEQGLQGDRGVSRIMFDKGVLLTDYYRSELLADPNDNTLGAWMIGIEHDSIRTTSEISFFQIIVDEDSVQIWQSFGFAGEVFDGRFGIFDPSLFFLAQKLRIIVTN